jgi:hypothetical protein
MSGNARYPIIEGGFVCQGRFAEIFSKLEHSSPTCLQLDYYGYVFLNMQKRIEED